MRFVAGGLGLTNVDSVQVASAAQSEWLENKEAQE